MHYLDLYFEVSLAALARPIPHRNPLRPKVVDILETGHHLIHKSFPGGPHEPIPHRNPLRAKVVDIRDTGHHLTSHLTDMFSKGFYYEHNYAIMCVNCVH